MSLTLPLFLPTFKHGIHPEEHKERTAHRPIEQMPFVERYTVPLSQHIGKPAKAVVSKGDQVIRGQVIGVPDGFVSTSIHAPVTGKVVEVGLKRHPNGQLVQSVVIETDLFSPQRVKSLNPPNWLKIDRDRFVEEIQKAGIVGLGGAAFPSHVKYALPPGKKCEWLVLNGCECEPYLTCDHRMMLEQAEEIIRGTEILLYHLKAKGAIIGIESNKADAAEALQKAIPPSLPIEVRLLETKYPQGAEKMLITALFGKEIPAGKLPLDIGIVVNNVGTMAAIAEYFEQGKPLIDRVLTVSGPGIGRAGNLRAPVGTPVMEILEYSQYDPEAQQVIMGGPMMGMSLSSLEVPIVKGTSGILAFRADQIYRRPEYPCVRCGRCVEACPTFLNPSKIARSVQAERYDLLDDLYIMDCIECGSCSLVCPSGIPIVQLIRTGKSILREKRRK